MPGFAFTNPTPADDLDTPTVLHSTQHAQLNDAVEELDTRVSVLESAIDQLEAAVNTLKSAARVRYIFCPGDNRTYRVVLDLVDGVADLNWAVSPIQMRLVDGVATVDDVPVDAPADNFDRLYTPDGVAYDMRCIDVEGEITLDWNPL